LHAELVPIKMTEVDFWKKYFKSIRFNKEKLANNAVDLTSISGKDDELIRHSTQMTDENAIRSFID